MILGYVRNVWVGRRDYFDLRVYQVVADRGPISSYGASRVLEANTTRTYLSLCRLEQRGWVSAIWVQMPKAYPQRRYIVKERPWHE